MFGINRSTLRTELIRMRDDIGKRLFGDYGCSCFNLYRRKSNSGILGRFGYEIDELRIEIAELKKTVEELTAKKTKKATKKK